LEKKDDYRKLLSRLDIVQKQAAKAKRDANLCLIACGAVMAILLIGVLNGVRLQLGY
jgi:hypothetical protein